MKIDWESLTKGLERRPGAPEETIVAVETELTVHLPDEYRSFIRFADGARGWIRDVYLELWRIEDVPGLMEAGLIRQRLPGVVPIGGDGSRENLAFDMTREPPPIVLADITCGNRDDLIVRASGLFEFLEMIQEGGDLFPPDL